MTAPFAPELVSPINKAGVGTTSLVVQGRFRTFVAGDSAGSYTLRRRQMAPSLGAYEYWNATTPAWQAGTVDNTLAATTYFDNSLVTVTATPGTAGSVYQWSMSFKNQTAEASPYAADILYQTHAVPTMTLNIPTTFSRPRVRWTTTFPAGYYMRSYQIAAYTAAVRNATNFDPSLAVWQAQATYITPLKYSSSDYFNDPSVDFPSGTQFYWYYKVEDSSGLSSGWVLATNVTMSYVSPQAPTVILTADPANGNVLISTRSAFNLVPDSTSTMPTDRGSWLETLNADAEWDPARVSLKVTAAGMTYAALDTAQGTYANQDSAYATYAVQQATQSSPTLTTRVATGTALAAYYPAVASTTYSAICDIFTNTTGRFAKINFLWFQTGGAASAVTPRSSGSATALPSGVTTTVRNFAVTSPSDAAWFAIEVEFTSPPVGDIFWIDNVAAATAASVQWSPSNLVDVSFVVEKTKDGGLTWEAVWGCSRSNPKASDTGVLTQINVIDRSAYLGVQAWSYRIYAISNFSTTPIWSAPTVTVAPQMAPDAWWFKNTKYPAYDVQPKVGGLEETTDVSDTSYLSENSKFPVFVTANEPDVASYSVSITVLTEEAHQAVISSLASKATLYLQTNTEGIGYYLRVSGPIGKRQLKSTSDKSWKTMRSAYEFNFKATEVAPYEG